MVAVVETGSDYGKPSGGGAGGGFGWFGLRALFRAIFGTGADDRLYAQSAKQYLIALNSTYFSLRANSKADTTSPIWDELKRILAKYPEDSLIVDDMAAWDDAHRCERLLVDIYDPDRLDVELGRRILEAQKSGLEYADYFAGRLQKVDPGGTALSDAQQASNRSLLAKLIEDQQWHNTRRYMKRGYAHSAQKRVFKAFIAAFLVFALMTFIVFESRNRETASEQVEQAPVSPASSTTQPPAP